MACGHLRQPTRAHLGLVTEAGTAEVICILYPDSIREQQHSAERELESVATSVRRRALIRWKAL